MIRINDANALRNEDLPLNDNETRSSRMSLVIVVIT